MLKRLLYLSLLTILLCSCQNNRNDMEETDYKKINNTEQNGGYLRLANEPPSLNNPPTSDVFPLFMTDFKERWNAISDEQTGDNYIEEFTAKDNPLHFVTLLKKNLELEIHTLDENQITEIIINGTGQNSSDFLKMLTSWWQVFLITNPGTDFHEIDAIFSEIGVGPNSQLEELTDRTFSYGGLLYEVNTTENWITFKARYPVSQGGE
ncbi:hypothetical protein [Pseudoneobacillus sp. C159]